MDKERIEAIALEVAKEMPNGVLWDSETEGGATRAEIRYFATRFLARIDAERGKEAVPEGYALVPVEQQKNASRYEWLRNSSVGPSQIWELLSDDCCPPIMTLKCMGDLDSAIDAAMLTAAKEPRHA